MPLSRTLLKISLYCSSSVHEGVQISTRNNNIGMCDFMLLLHQKEIEISSWKTTSHRSDIEKSVYLMWYVVLHEKALLSNSRK